MSTGADGTTLRIRTHGGVLMARLEGVMSVGRELGHTFVLSVEPSLGRPASNIPWLLANSLPRLFVTMAHLRSAVSR